MITVGELSQIVWFEAIFVASLPAECTKGMLHRCSSLHHCRYTCKWQCDSDAQNNSGTSNIATGSTAPCSGKYMLHVITRASITTSDLTAVTHGTDWRCGRTLCSVDDTHHSMRCKHTTLHAQRIRHKLVHYKLDDSKRSQAVTRVSLTSRRTAAVT